MPSSRTAVTYSPDTNEERLIVLLSQKMGLDTSRVISLALRQMAEREHVANHTTLKAEEQARLDALNTELPKAFWKRYRALAAKLSEERITEEERQELIRLTDQSEAWNVRRLELLEELAQKRGMHFPELMQTLGIRHHPDA